MLLPLKSVKSPSVLLLGSQVPHGKCPTLPTGSSMGSGQLLAVASHLPTSKGEVLASSALAKPAAIGKVASQFFWHRAKTARLGA